jgi:phosphatidylglycerol---prolipoprotein diacylglyceryl transferase
MKSRIPVILRPRKSDRPRKSRASTVQISGRIGPKPMANGEQAMRPILFVVPGLDLRVHSYGVFIFLACTSALAMAVWRSRREKVQSDAVYELATWLFLGGVIGARLFYFIQHPEAFHHVGDLFRTWQGGNVFYGCILGGLTGSILYWFRRPFPFLRMCDVAAPAVAIGAGVGRIGCFLNGCCHGGVCSLPWAVRFPAGSHAWVRQLNAGLVRPGDAFSLPVHPTQLYSAGAAMLVLGILLLFARRRDRRPGEIMALLMIVYPLTRWPLEALRSDEPSVFLGMSWSQNISVALLLAGMGAWTLLRRGRGDDDRAAQDASLDPHLQGSLAPMMHSADVPERANAPDAYRR